MQPEHLSGKLLGQVTGTQRLLEVHLLVASLQEQLGFQGKCLPLWELVLQAIWVQTLATLLLTNIPPDQISTLFYGTCGLLPLINLFLGHLLTRTTRTLPPKILLMPLTGPDNPLLCHYFCYYLMCVWRRQWHPTPVLLPGKSHGRRSLVGCSPSCR